MCIFLIGHSSSFLRWLVLVIIPFKIVWGHAFYSIVLEFVFAFLYWISPLSFVYLLVFYLIFCLVSIVSIFFLNFHFLMFLLFYSSGIFKLKIMFDRLTYLFLILAVHISFIKFIRSITEVVWHLGVKVNWMFNHGNVEPFFLKEKLYDSL